MGFTKWAAIIFVVVYFKQFGDCGWATCRWSVVYCINKCVDKMVLQFPRRNTEMKYLGTTTDWYAQCDLTLYRVAEVVEVLEPG